MSHIANKTKQVPVPFGSLNGRFAETKLARPGDSATSSRSRRFRFPIVLLLVMGLLGLNFAPAQAAGQMPNENAGPTSAPVTAETVSVHADTEALEAEQMESLKGALTDDELSSLFAIEEHIGSDGQLDIAAATDDPRIDQAFLEDFAGGYASGADHGSGSVMSNCVGINANLYQQVWLDSCNASALSTAIATGAGIPAIIGILTSSGVGTVVAGVMAAALGMYSGLAALCNSWGRGIILSTQAPACWSQPAA